jgi:2-deoxy-D-gluconate 3-dehydrogenase
MSEQTAAIVTGGASGIGKAVVERYAKKGYSVAIVDVNEAELTSSNVKYYKTNVTSVEETKQTVKQIFEDFGRVDILVNCAGIGIRKPSLDFSKKEIEQVMDVNLYGTILMCQAVAPYMKETGGGSIVNIASMLAHYGSTKGLAYASSKGAVVMATKCFAVDWAKHNIRVNAVSPGHIATSMTGGFLKDEVFYNYLLGRTPQHRLGRPEEVASAIDFLTSPEASFITGVDLPVDGGLLAGDPNMSSNISD